MVAGGDKVRMLGGGQPAHIGEINATWRRRLEEIMAGPGELEHMLGNYEGPAGNQPSGGRSRSSSGGSSGGTSGRRTSPSRPEARPPSSSSSTPSPGRFADGRRRKKILLPLVPEYIGYANQSVGRRPVPWR